MAALEEQRRFVRVGARLELAYAVLPDGMMRRTAIVDVSAGGLRLLTEQPVPTGASLQIAVSLPGCEHPVHAIAQPRWTQTTELLDRRGPQRSVQTGLAFVEIAPADQEALGQFIMTHLS